jgi:hypothetical protein
VVVIEPRYAAAWVPAARLPGEAAAAVQSAIDWTAQQCTERRMRALVLYPTWRIRIDGSAELDRFAGRHEAATVRSRHHVRPGDRPVLAYAPTYTAMSVAAGIAGSTALCVVEWSPEELIGWAMEVHALDLTTGEPTPDTRSPELLESLLMLLSYANNGWGDAFGKQRAAELLDQIKTRHELDPHIIIGYAVAHGAGDSEIRNLSALIQQA